MALCCRPPTYSLQVTAHRRHTLALISCVNPAQVQRGNGAARAGVRVGDRLYAVNGTAVGDHQVTTM